MTKDQFSLEVQKMLAKNKDLTCIDGVLTLCNKYGIDPEDANKFLNASIKEKIEYEARKLNLMPREMTLEKFI